MSAEMNSLYGVALLFGKQEGTEGVFLGSCFAYRQRTHFLAANHCVKERTTTTLLIVSPTDGLPRSVLEVRTHPTADLSLLVVEPRENDLIEPFWGCVGNYSLGEDFFAFGFPEDSALGPNTGRPTARLFKGHFQRFMHHKSQMGYSYIAAELSIACPEGLSGGPLFRPEAPVMLTGLVAENIEAATFRDSQEIEQPSGRVVREHWKVINYGVSVMLEPVNDWLDEHVSPRNARGYVGLAKEIRLPVRFPTAPDFVLQSFRNPKCTAPDLDP